MRGVFWIAGIALCSSLSVTAHARQTAASQQAQTQAPPAGRGAPPVAGRATAAQGRGDSATPATPGRGGGRGGGPAAPLEISTDLTGFIPMFNGVDLKGWDGPMPLWHVENGAIVVRRTMDPPIPSTYLIWQGGQPKDFEMVFDVKLEGDGANSGVQFRAALLGEVPDRAPVAGYNFTKWETHGYQADMTNSGGANNIIECCRGPRRGLPPRPDANASRGTVTRSATVEGGPKNLLANLEDTNTLRGYWKQNDWNTLRIIARGRTFLYICNGHLLAAMMDDSPTFYQDHGYIAIQLEGAAPNAAYFKNLWIKLLPE